MPGCGCDDRFAVFDRRAADADRRRYRRGGPDRTTRMLLDILLERGVADASVLDVGGGIGVIDHELLRAGARQALLVDASSAYLDAARLEWEEAGGERGLSMIQGDFVALADGIPPADVVTLDRVVCCFPDVGALVGLSAARARRLYGLVLPRDRLVARIAIALVNAWYRLRGTAYRAFVHPNALVDTLAVDAGLLPVAESGTYFWRVVLFERTGV
jgi:magnesium-protoporphyrin O-methyltransferase